MPLRPLAATLVGGLLLAPLPHQNPADKFEYYHVYGTTPNEVRQSINTLGPSNGTGRRYDASTRNGITWKSTVARGEAGCTIATFEVTVATTYLLPKWRDEPIAPAATVQQWRTYLLALKRHETGHKKIALEGADSMRAIALRLAPHPECDAVVRMSNDSARAVLARIGQAQQKYDLDTQHGRSQGAVFPQPN